MLPLELLGEVSLLRPARAALSASSRQYEFSQIFSQLPPSDLLRLRMLDKRFHQTLSAKASESIWAASRRRIGLLDVELHHPLTEWQYAELIFGKTCQVGHTLRATPIDSS